MSVSETFAARLRAIRKKRGLTQAKLAQRIFATASQISSWEVSRTEPSLEALMQLAQALGVSPNLLLGWKKEETTNG